MPSYRKKRSFLNNVLAPIPDCILNLGGVWDQGAAAPVPGPDASWVLGTQVLRHLPGPGRSYAWTVGGIISERPRL